MVQSEHDPATPIEGARRAASRFAGARMLTVTNEGDHGLYAGGNSCVDTAVEKFIQFGTLPAEGGSCAGKPPPDPTQAIFQARSDGFAIRSSGTDVGPSGTRSAALPVPGTNPLVALRLLSALTQ
jgi:hypothetical protein